MTGTAAHTFTTLEDAYRYGIGKRVEVYWPQEAKWYNVIVTARKKVGKEKKEKYKVSFDLVDGGQWCVVFTPYVCMIDVTNKELIFSLLFLLISSLFFSFLLFLFSIMQGRVCSRFDPYHARRSPGWRWWWW